MRGRPRHPHAPGRGLFQIPLPLRERIYALVTPTLTFPTTITIQNRYALCKAIKLGSKLSIRPRRDLRLLGISSQIREEVFEVLGRNATLVIDDAVCDCWMCAGRFKGKPPYEWVANRKYIVDNYLERLETLEVIICDRCIEQRRRQPFFPDDVAGLRRLVINEDDLVYQDRGGEKNALNYLREGLYDKGLIRRVCDRKWCEEQYGPLYWDVEQEGREFEVVHKISALVRYLSKAGESRYYLLRLEVDYDTKNVVSRKGQDVTRFRPDWDCQLKHDADGGQGVSTKEGCHGRACLPLDNMLDVLPLV